MTVDGIGSNFGGFMGDLPRRSVVQPSGADASRAMPARHSASTQFGGLDFGTVQPALGATAHGLDKKAEVLSLWSDKAYLWGSREAMAEAVNRVARFDRQHNTANRTVDAEKLGHKAATHAVNLDNTLNYAKLFHLGDRTLSIGKDLSWANYKETVNKNFARFRRAIRPDKIGGFFKGVTPARFIKETVYETNAKPIKDLFSNNPDKQIGSGIFRIGAFGLMTYDAFRQAAKVHQQAQAQEDGSFADKLNTWKETGLTFGKYLLRSAITWEVGGLAFAFGRALLPIAVGCIPIGGILIGALVGALVQSQVLDPMLGTSSEKEENETKDGEQEGPAGSPGAVANPFAIA